MAAQEPPVALNDLVEVEVREGPMAGRYRTRVEGVAPGRLTLAVPMYRGAKVSIPVGSAVSVLVLKADPVRGARYQGETRVIERLEERQVPLVVLEMPRWQRIQLRSFLRVPVRVPVRWRRPVPPGSPGGAWGEAESRDLGGGGVLLWFRDGPWMDPGTALELALELPTGIVEAAGEVVRVVEPQQAEQEGREVAVKFTGILERDRDRIIAYLLRRQAEMRRMGLI
ncbi:flagellar brake domain-containing protein [Carboxydochorda subterranea]|uniref:Flagellar brake domain-containing protein n=1 Tax=Carboxydichorda subterranea TaxID=3109565 RepID=A0ABZ1C103_9FIRM|nr:flagellar brake domain-containing protein [Limnochorda sp. L945t]WRP18466.1 flagellar brake domain-containing protein [Limnochorda sp. L945t]